MLPLERELIKNSIFKPPPSPVKGKALPDADTIEGRNYTELRSDINVADGADVTGSNAPQAHAPTHESGGSDVVATDITLDTAPVLGADLNAGSFDINTVKNITYVAEVAQIVSADFTIDWTAGQKQSVDITGTNLAAAFTDPAGPCNLLLKVIQGDGSDTITWPSGAPGDVLWPGGGTAPTLSTGNNEIDIISFYFDGTDYYGVANTDFA